MICELIDTEVENVVGGGSFNVINAQNFLAQYSNATGGNAASVLGSAVGGPAVSFDSATQQNTILNG